MVRQLRYPYTLGAMVRQFPLKYHMDKSWIYKAYALGLVLSAPVFLKVTNIFPAEAGVWGSPITYFGDKKH